LNSLPSSVSNEMMISLARINYLAYLQVTHYLKYRPATHLRYIAKICEKIEAEELKRVMFFLPPRHGKSLSVTESFPSWFIGKNPDRRVIEVSYGESLARRFGRANRRKIEEFGPTLFQIGIAGDNASVSNWSIEGHDGGMISTSIGGPATGSGADCLIAGTLIETEIGEIDIQALHKMHIKPKVLTFNHKMQTLQMRRVLASREIERDGLVEIETAGGHKLTATRKHRIYIQERGYRPAYLLLPGDRIISKATEEKQSVSVLWESKRRRWANLQGMLQQGEKSDRNANLLFLPENLRAAIVRIRKSFEKWQSGSLLLQGLLRSAPCSQECQTVSAVQQSHAWKTQQHVLFGAMQERGTGCKETPEKMPRMWRHFHKNFYPYGLLLSKVCKCSSLQEDDRTGQSSFQRWKKLCRVVFSHEALDSGTGRTSLYCVWKDRELSNHPMERPICEAKQSIHAPSGRQCREQCSGEPDHNVRRVPYPLPQIEGDVVVSVKELGTPAVPVYDLQVEEESNFFANGILVHNCLIIDDPVKNRQEADSLTYRDMLWDEYRNTLLTRLQPNASIILIQTRWHEDDLAGRILAQEPEKWYVVKLPAEAEDEDPLGRAPGEPLWPEFGFDWAWIENTKKTLGSQVWNALYQQRPAPQEGALVKRSWWKYYIVAPSHFDDIVLSWDMTFKDEAAAASGNPDYVVGQVWGRVEADKYLLDQVRGKMDFPDTLKAVRALKAKWKESTAILIEDSANGPAIIASLKHEISGIIPWPAQGSKTERLSAVAPQIEAGNVYIPDSIIAEWISDYVEEFAVFPNGNNDDQVDATTQALRYWMRADKAPASISSYRELRVNP